MTGSPVEPPVDLPGWKTIAAAAYGLLILIVGGVLRWVIPRFQGQLMSHSDRIAKLENTSITREELERHVEKLEKASLRMHTENRDSLTRIEEKVMHASESRHDIRDSTHSVQTMLREVLERLRKQGAVSMSEEADFPTSDVSVEAVAKRLAITAFSLSGCVEAFKQGLDTLRNNLTLRSASMHRVAITVGGGMFWFLAALLLVVGIVLGLDISERSAQRRQWDLNTATLQREWIRDTKATNDHMDDLARKYRMAELKYDELNLTLRRAGLSVPNDLYGVGANLDPDSFGHPSPLKRK